MIASGATLKHSGSQPLTQANMLETVKRCYLISPVNVSFLLETRAKTSSALINMGLILVPFFAWNYVQYLNHIAVKATVVQLLTMTLIRSPSKTGSISLLTRLMAILLSEKLRFG